MTNSKKLADEVSAWPGVTIHPHRFGAKEFRFGSAEIGHIHIGGIVDIPFPRSLHDALLAGGLARQHRWVPNSGWITFHIHGEHGLNHALWLLRLSYLRYALKNVSDPRHMLEQQSEQLHLSPEFRSLLEKFIPAKASQAVAEALPT